MSIILKKLNKRFGDNLVVNNVSLEILDGELFVMLGASGSGKSTILRMIAGLLEPDSGSIMISGQDVTHLEAQKRNVGFVFQNYSLFGHLMVFENVEFGLQVRKIPIRERRIRGKELLEVIGLTGLGDRYPHQLSGGQQQRVAVARALAYNPKVLLMDEPFGALDVKIRATLRQNLREIQRRLNVTTILVTHDQEEAFELADRIGVIERGMLVETGPPDHLYHHPETETVAMFIGGGNVLVGREDNGQIRLGEILLPWPEKAFRHAEGSPVRVLFRPETVMASREPFHDPQFHILGQGRVVKRIFNGPVQRLILNMDQLRGVRPLVPALHHGQTRTQIEIIQTTQGLDHPIQIDDVLWVGIRDYHVLKPSGIKILVYSDDPIQNPSAQTFALHLGRSVKGLVSLISTVDSEEGIAQKQGQLDRIRLQWQDQIPQISVQVMNGSIQEAIQTKIQSDLFDFLALDRDCMGLNSRTGMEKLFQTMLEEIALPVIVVSAPQSAINHILICTAAGEPGKSDIQVGGRLSLRTGAKVTLLSAMKPSQEGSELERVTQYLEEAGRSIATLGVDCRPLVRTGNPLDEIILEARKPQYDVIVIGAVLPRAPQKFRWPEVAIRIIQELGKTVVIVPMQEHR